MAAGSRKWPRERARGFVYKNPGPETRCRRAAAKAGWPALPGAGPGAAAAASPVRSRVPHRASMISLTSSSPRVSLVRLKGGAALARRAFPGNGNRFFPGALPYYTPAKGLPASSWPLAVRLILDQRRELVDRRRPGAVLIRQAGQVRRQAAHLGRSRRRGPRQAACGQPPAPAPGRDLLAEAAEGRPARQREPVLGRPRPRPGPAGRPARGRTWPGPAPGWRPRRRPSRPRRPRRLCRPW